jgi:hypothetical protein
LALAVALGLNNPGFFLTNRLDEVSGIYYYVCVAKNWGVEMNAKQAAQEILRALPFAYHFKGAWPAYCAYRRYLGFEQSFLKVRYSKDWRAIPVLTIEGQDFDQAQITKELKALLTN